METRIKKWENYRKKIVNQDHFFNLDDKQEKKIQSYHNRINRISQNILTNGEEMDDTIIPLIVNDHNKKKMFNDLKKVVQTVGEEKREIITQEIKDVLYSYKNNSIIDPQTNKISKSWLQNESGYNDLEIYETLINLTEQKLIEFQTTSSQKIDNLEKAINENVKATHEDLETYKVDKISEKIKKKTNRKFYFFLISAIVIVIIAIITLVIIRLVYYA